MSTPAATGPITSKRSARIVTLVSGLGAAQSVAVVTQVNAIRDTVGRSLFGSGSTAHLVLGLLSAVFLTVAITVTSVVVTSSAEVALTGQLKDVALRRLLGASASEERRRIRRLVMRRAVTGMAGGVVAGYLVSVTVLELGVTSSYLHLRAGAFVPSPMLLIALLAQVLATSGAARRGTRGVLDVQPVQAVRTSTNPDGTVGATLAVPPRASGPTLVLGLLLMTFALLTSRDSPIAMLPAVAGGVVSFVGLLSYGHLFVPRLLALVSRGLPRSLPFVLARRRLLQNPVRSSRAAMAVAGPITLVTTFTVAISSFHRSVDEHYTGSAFREAAADVLSSVTAVMLLLTAFLVVTATVALCNSVAFGAWLRRRDTALLRILGQSGRGTRATAVAESLLLASTATVFGVALGTFYGWIGAQSMFGAEVGGIVAPVVPWQLLLGVVAGVAALTLLAAVSPVRQALRLTPIRAYLAA